MVKEPYTKYNAPEPFNSFLVKIIYCLAFSPFKIVPGSLIRSDNFLVTTTERDIKGWKRSENLSIEKPNVGNLFLMWSIYFNLSNLKSVVVILWKYQQPTSVWTHEYL